MTTVAGAAREGPPSSPGDQDANAGESEFSQRYRNSIVKELGRLRDEQETQRRVLLELVRMLQEL
jgi:hypothetical protein